MDGETEGNERLRRKLERLQLILGDMCGQLQRQEELVAAAHDPQRRQGAAGSSTTAAIVARHTLTACLRLARHVSRLRLKLFRKDVELEILSIAQRLVNSLEADSPAQQDRTDEGPPTRPLDQLAHSSSSSPASSSHPPAEIGVVNEDVSPGESRKQKASTSGTTGAESSSADCLNVAGTSSGIQREASNSKVDTLSLNTEEIPVSLTENSRVDGDGVHSSHSTTPPSETIIPSTASPGKLQSQNVFPTGSVDAEPGETSVDEVLEGATEPVKGDDNPQETTVSQLAEDFSAFCLTDESSTRKASPVRDGRLPNQDETEDILSTDTISQVTAEREQGTRAKTDTSSGQEAAVCHHQSMDTSTKTGADSLSVTNEAVPDDQNTREHPTTDTSSQNTHSGEVLVDRNSHCKPKTSSPGNSHRDSEADSPSARTHFKLVNVSLVSWKVERRKSPPAYSVEASTSPGNRATGISSCDDSKSTNRQTESYECSKGDSPLPVEKLSGNIHIPDSEAQSLSPEEKSAAFQNKTNCQSTCRFLKRGRDSVSAEMEREKTMEVPNLTQAGMSKTSGEVLLERNNRSKAEKASQGSSHRDCKMDSPAAHTRFKFWNASLRVRKAVRKSVPAKSVDVKASTSGNCAAEISSYDHSKSANRQTESYGRNRGVTLRPIEKLSGKRQVPDLEAHSLPSPKKSFQSKGNSNRSTCEGQERGSTSASAQTKRNEETEGANITPTASVNEADRIARTVPGELSVKRKDDSGSENRSPANNHPDSAVDSPAAHTRFKVSNVSLLSQKAGRKSSPALCVDENISTSAAKNAREIRSSGETKSAKTRTESFVCTRGAYRVSSVNKSAAFQNRTNGNQSTFKGQKRSRSFLEAQSERNKNTGVPIIIPTGKVKKVDSSPSTVKTGLTENSVEVLVDSNSRSKPQKTTLTHPTDREMDSPAAHTRFKFSNISLPPHRKSAPAHSVAVTASTPGKRARETSCSDDDKSAHKQRESGVSSKGCKSRSKEKLCENLKPDSQFSTHFQKKSRRSFGSLFDYNGTGVRRVTSAVCSSNVRATRGDSLSLRTRSNTGNYHDLRRKVNKTKCCVSCSPPLNRPRSLGSRNESASLGTRPRMYRL